MLTDDFNEIQRKRLLKYEMIQFNFIVLSLHIFFIILSALKIKLKTKN